MNNLQAMNTQDLLDLLAKQTEKLTSKLAVKDKEAIRLYENEVRLLQAELNTRVHVKINKGN